MPYQSYAADILGILAAILSLLASAVMAILVLRRWWKQDMISLREEMNRALAERPTALVAPPRLMSSSRNRNMGGKPRVGAKCFEEVDLKSADLIGFGFLLRRRDGKYVFVPR